MSKEPEQVLPENNTALLLWIKEVRAQESIKEQHHLSASEHGQGKQHQYANREHKPHKERHAHECHAWTTHAQNGGHEINSRSHTAKSADHDSKNPVVRGVSNTECLACER